MNVILAVADLIYGNNSILLDNAVALCIEYISFMKLNSEKGEKLAYRSLIGNAGHIIL